MNDNLQYLVDFIQEKTGATGVYVGKLVHQKKPITESSGVDEDLDLDAPMVIHYTNATASHKHMVNVTLTSDQAPLSHSVFNFVKYETSPAAEEATA